MFAEGISAILEEMRQNYEKLLEFAASKRELILSGDNDRLIEVTGLEERAAAEIEKLEKSRRMAVHEFLAERRLPPDTSFAQILKKGFFGTQTATMEGLRDSIITLVNAVKTQNDENVAVIEASRSVINSTLEYIRTIILQRRQGNTPVAAATYSRPGAGYGRSQMMAAPAPSDNSLINFVA